MDASYLLHEFKANDFITLRLEQVDERKWETAIYLKGERFNQCKFLLIEIPIDRIASFDEIESIDDAAERLDRSLEGNRRIEYDIPPETEFWGHCSNIQVWFENDYDTRLLHRNLAFPLLKRLTELGDSLAKKVFKDEIAKRLNSGLKAVQQFLIDENYLKYFNREEIDLLNIKPEIEKITGNLLISIKNNKSRDRAYAIKSIKKFSYLIDKSIRREILDIVKGSDFENLHSYLKDGVLSLLIDEEFEEIVDDFDSNSFYEINKVIEREFMSRHMPSPEEEEYNEVFPDEDIVPTYYALREINESCQASFKKFIEKLAANSNVYSWLFIVTEGYLDYIDYRLLDEIYNKRKRELISGFGNLFGREYINKRHLEQREGYFNDRFSEEMYYLMDHHWEEYEKREKEREILETPVQYTFNKIGKKYPQILDDFGNYILNSGTSSDLMYANELGYVNITKSSAEVDIIIENVLDRFIFNEDDLYKAFDILSDMGEPANFIKKLNDRDKNRVLESTLKFIKKNIDLINYPWSYNYLPQFLAAFGPRAIELLIRFFKTCKIEESLSAVTEALVQIKNSYSSELNDTQKEMINKCRKCENSK